MFGFDLNTLVEEGFIGAFTGAWVSHPIIWSIIGLVAWTVVGAVIFVVTISLCTYLINRVESKLIEKFNIWVQDSWYIWGPLMPLVALLISSIKIRATIQRFHYRKKVFELTEQKPWKRGQDVSFMRRKFEGYRKAYMLLMEEEADSAKREQHMKKVIQIEKFAKLYGLTLMSREDLQKETRRSEKLILPIWA